MRRFGRRALVFVAIQAALAAALSPGYLRAITDTRSYLAVWRDKQRLLLQTPAPRVVLVGGSNLAFGVDSERLGKGVGRHAVNLGLHAGLGEEYLLRWAEAGLQPGDIVLVSLEYEQFCDPLGGHTLINLIQLQPEAARYADPPELLRLVLDRGLNELGRLPKIASLELQGVEAQRVAAPYSRASFNPWGDVVAHRGMAPRPQRAKFIEVCREGRVRKAIGRLNDFARRCRVLGAVPVFSFPAVPAVSFRVPGNRLPWLGERVRAGLEMPVLSAPEETAYGPLAFFDTSYHLTQRGASRRTSLLIERLSRIPEVTGSAGGSQPSSRP